MTTVNSEAATYRDLRLANLTRNNVLWAMGIGLIPIPVVDYLGVMGVQVKALKELSDEYNVPFSENQVKTLVTALLSGLGSHGLKGIVASFAKFIPIVGGLIGGLSFSISAGAITYAVSKTFIQHFESGGTFLNFNPQKVREAFQQQVDAGAKYAESVKAESAQAVA